MIFNRCNNKSKSIDINNDIKEYSKKDYDTISRNNLLKLASKYAYSRRFYEINKIIINKSESIKDTLGIINAKSNIGLYFFNEFYNDSAYYYFSKAEKLSKKTKGNPHLSEILQSKADLRWCQKDFSGDRKSVV